MSKFNIKKERGKDETRPVSNIILFCCIKSHVKRIAELDVSKSERKRGDGQGIGMAVGQTFE